MNKVFVLKMVKRLEDFFRSQDDSSIWSIREKLRLLDSLSMIEKNMKLASAFLPDLDQIYEVNINLFMKNMSQMRDNDLMVLSSFLRRIRLYNENYLEKLVHNVRRREIKELV